MGFILGLEYPEKIHEMPHFNLLYNNSTRTTGILEMNLLAKLRTHIHNK